ncbi:MAG: alpha/beta fold hydrolase [Actinomycetota bacterium]
MTQAIANGITLEYQSFGSAKAPAILLIMGLGAHMIRWNQELCDLLVARGYRVIRFDNRDCGLSTHLDQAPLPDLGAALKSGKLPLSPYSLEDMAADSVGLLDALGIDRAHVVGASLGAAVAQLIAARRPERTLSLTTIMSSSGNPLLPPPTPAAARALFAPLPKRRDRDSIVADGIQRFRAVESPAYPTDEARLRRLFETEYDRGFYPQGVARQLAALMANGDRRPLLRTISVPTVVLHGAADPLIRVEGGKDVAKNIPGAELRMVEGMGHDFPVQLTETFADAITAAANRAKTG